MRPVRQDLSFQTDASGNATIRSQLAMTGEWRIVKVALSINAPAEWAVVVSGTTVNYGRGRRVTLGPELLMPQDQVTVKVTGGPPSAPIVGSLSGIAGSADEVTPLYLAQPNAIALDVTTPHQVLRPTTILVIPTTPSFTVASGALSGAQVFTVKPGDVAVRIMVNASGLLFTYRLLVLGRQSVEQYFGDPNAPGASLAVPSPTLPITIPIETDWDSQVEIHVENPTQNVNVFVSALTDVEAPGQAGASQSVTIPVPAPWQAAQGFPVEFEVSLAAGAFATLVPGFAGVQRYLHTLSYFYLSIPVNSNLRFHDLSSGGNVLAPGVAAAHAWQTIDYHGAPILSAAGGVFLVNDGSAASDFAVGVLNYS